ncbi:MAG: MFS transporter [Tepidisphaeraceae bacterium]
MRSIRAQYFLSFGVLGSVMPFLSVFLRERGLNNAQVGYVTGAASLGVVLTPVLVTLLADAAVAGRVLMAGLFAASGALLAAVLGAHAFWPILACYTLHSLAYAPIIPLQDGIYFAAAEREKRLPTPFQKGVGSLFSVRSLGPYHVVRVWGTIGFIVPSVVLYFFLTEESTVAPAMACAIAMCAAGAVNAFFLPREANDEIATKAEPDASRLPTAAAARALLEPHMLVFCVAMALLYMASTGYYQFYPIHLTDVLHIDKRWVGLIAAIGVVVEIFFMLGFGRLRAAMTLRGLMIVGVGCIALRLLLLAFVPTRAVAIGQQLLHGMTVLVLLVAPPIYLNARAGDAYRSSIQGLYAMTVSGAARIVGSVLTGIVAEWSMTAMFAGCAGLCVIAAGLFYFAFREHVTEPSRAGIEQPILGERHARTSD